MLNLDETGLKRLKPSKGPGYEYFKTPFSSDVKAHNGFLFHCQLKIVIFLSVDIHSVFADLSGQ